jgi:hypothetical protein
VLNGETVEWSLGTLSSGKAGTRSVTVQTDGGLLRGALLRAEAAVFDSALPPQLARASSVAEIDGLEALETAIDLTLDQTDWAWKVDVTVTNDDVVSHTGVSLTLRVPRDALTFALGSVTGGAVGCNQILNNAFCEVGEILAWNLGTLTAGQSVTVSVPNLYIAHPTADLGELFRLEAIALGSGRRRPRSRPRRARARDRRVPARRDGASRRDRTVEASIGERAVALRRAGLLGRTGDATKDRARIAHRPSPDARRSVVGGVGRPAAGPICASVA